jgi:hypothetical protein
VKPEERLILLSWPRCGSSSLWKILQAHPDLDLFPHEPFNESFVDWSPGNPDCLSRVRDAATLDSVLAERRRNLLQIAVSDRIAKQTKLWNRWNGITSPWNRST